MRYEFHPEAPAEYNEAGHFYARRQPGLDLCFIVSVEAAIESILENPYRWRPFDEDVRRCLTRIFPYAVLYTIEREYVLIVAVAHCSREPGDTGSIEPPNNERCTQRRSALVFARVVVDPHQVKNGPLGVDGARLDLALVASDERDFGGTLMEAALSQHQRA